MRLLTFRPIHSPAAASATAPHIGVRVSDRILDLTRAAQIANASDFPRTLRALLASGAEGLARFKGLLADVQNHASSFATALLQESQVAYLPPIPDADKFLCVGKNYRAHLEELKRTNLIREIPEEPTAFVKLNSALVGHNAQVVRPEGIVRLDYEPELVFVIGHRALGVKKATAFDYIAGVTILNDLTCRDLQLREVASGSRFWTAKNIPGFGPLGPELITMDEIPDPYDLWMTCSVNGEQRMRVNTRDQIWKLPDIVEHFSQYIPLEPGDMFSTGAPGGVAVGKPDAEALYLKPGDVVECAIEGIAVLRTFIVAPQDTE